MTRVEMVVIEQDPVQEQPLMLGQTIQCWQALNAVPAKLTFFGLRHRPTPPSTGEYVDDPALDLIDPNESSSQLWVS